MLFLHFGLYLKYYWVNSDKLKCILSRKTREIQWMRYFSSFGDFSGSFEGVLVQLLLIRTLFSVQFYIRRKAVLSSIPWYDYFVCRVNRFRVMVDFVRDPDKFEIAWIRVSCCAFHGGLFVCLRLNARFFSVVYEAKGMKICTQVPRTYVQQAFSLRFSFIYLNRVSETWISDSAQNPTN